MREKILLVDDDVAVRDSIGVVLERENYKVIAAANGADALKIAADNEPDLVLLDLKLPDKSGWDTFERLTNENPFLPVIIITGRPNQLFTALGAGVGALMEKPLDYPKLLRTIRELIAEPREVRLARMAGRPAEFHYLPPRPS